MLAFLIVEDDLDHLRSIVVQLKKLFRGVNIRTARSVSEAEEVLSLAEKEGLTFKIVVLDFRLPRSQEDPTQVIDLETRRRVQSSPATEGATVFHITAYLDDPEIQQYVTEKHLQKYIKESRLKDPQAPVPFIIPKEGLWTEDLYEAIQRVVHGDRIAARLDRVFGERSGQVPSAMRRRTDQPSFTSTTHEIAALARDVELHWPYLSEGLRNRIRRNFILQPEGNTVRVGLT